MGDFSFARIFIFSLTACAEIFLQVKPSVRILFQTNILIKKKNNFSKVLRYVVGFNKFIT